MTTTTTAALLSTEGPAQDFDYDIGATAKERNAILDEVHETWAQIRALAETQDPKQVLWDKRDLLLVSPCQQFRPQFLPESVETLDGGATDK